MGKRKYRATYRDSSYERNSSKAVRIVVKSESTIGPGRGGTSHLSDFHQTLPIERVQ